MCLIRDDFDQGLVENVKDKGAYKEGAESFVDVFLKTMESPQGAESPEIFTGRSHSFHSASITHELLLPRFCWSYSSVRLIDFVFSEENLITILYDLFVAAGDTTSGTLAFGLLWLTLNPEVQEKCYEEIVKVIGKDRLPQLTDKME